MQNEISGFILVVRSPSGSFSDFMVKTDQSFLINAELTFRSGCPFKCARCWFGGKAPSSEHEWCGYMCEHWPQPPLPGLAVAHGNTHGVRDLLGWEGGGISWAWGRAGPYFWSRCSFGRNSFWAFNSILLSCMEALSAKTPNPSRALQGKMAGGGGVHEEVKMEYITTSWGGMGRNSCTNELCGAQKTGPWDPWSKMSMWQRIAQQVHGWAWLVHLHPRIYSKTWCLSVFSTGEIWEYLKTCFVWGVFCLFTLDFLLFWGFLNCWL